MIREGKKERKRKRDFVLFGEFVERIFVDNIEESRLQIAWTCLWSCGSLQ
jgi:hypothetical protein